MNVYLVLVVAFLILDWVLDFIVHRAILKSLRPEVPAEFAAQLDRESYFQNQRYTSSKVSFSDAQTNFEVIKIIALIGSGAFGFLHGFVIQQSANIYVQSMIYVGIMIVFDTIIGTPWSVYQTFVLEAKYGFNRTTVKTFVLDMLKGLLLGIIIGTPILLFIIFFFSNVAFAWLWVWAGITLFSLVMAFIAPVVIMPIFNKFVPLEDGELKDSIESYAKAHDFKFKGIFKTDGSRRSSHANAYFAGFGKFKRIALYDTLIEKLSTDEIVSVLAHEVGHNKLKHTLKGFITGAIQTLMLFGFMGMIINNPSFYAAFGIEGTPIYAGLFLVFFLYTPISTLTKLITNYLSRQHEYEADAFAQRTVGTADYLISGLKKMSVDSKSNLTPPRLQVILEYSHPPILERINAMRNR